MKFWRRRKQRQQELEATVKAMGELLMTMTELYGARFTLLGRVMEQEIVRMNLEAGLPNGEVRLNGGRNASGLGRAIYPPVP